MNVTLKSDFLEFDFQFDGINPAEVEYYRRRRNPRDATNSIPNDIMKEAKKPFSFKIDRL